MPNTVISVRGRAHLDVAPDLVTLFTTVSAVAKTRVASLSSANAHSHTVSESLEKMGATAIDHESTADPFVYARQSVSSTEETAWDEHARKHVPTGNIKTVVHLRINLRRFELLDTVTDALTQHGASLGAVIWQADADNPSWRVVRKAAVHAAIAQARDYADALSGTLVSIEHLADAGLLGTDGGQSSDGAPMLYGAAARRGSSTQETELTPTPQRLHAVVEARFLVDGAAPL